MAGRRQHYLPRFLQRTFRYRTNGTQDYAHAHESTRSYAPSTMGLGQERDFYGNPEESCADDNVTESENRLALILNRLNENPSSVSQGEQALLVAALAVRTKKMRESLETTVKVFINELAGLIQTHGIRRQEIEAYWSDKSKLEEMIQGELKKLPPMPREMRAKLVARLKQEWHRRREQIIVQMQVSGRALAAELFARMDHESAQWPIELFAESSKMTRRSRSEWPPSPNFTIFPSSMHPTAMSSFLGTAPRSAFALIAHLACPSAILTTILRWIRSTSQSPPRYALSRCGRARAPGLN